MIDVHYPKSIGWIVLDILHVHTNTLYTGHQFKIGSICGVATTLYHDVKYKNAYSCFVYNCQLLKVFLPAFEMKIDGS